MLFQQHLANPRKEKVVAVEPTSIECINQEGKTNPFTKEYFMLYHFQKRWYYFDNGLMGTDANAAKFLKKWYREMSIKGHLPLFFELIDLHAYKKIDKISNVRMALKNDSIKPFSFLVCKN